MTPQQRCLAAISGESVDRPPRYLPAIACEVASRVLDREVCSGTGSLHYAETCALMQGASAHEDFEEKLFEDLADLNRALGIDVYRMPWRQSAKPALQVDDRTFVFGDPDGAHAIWRYAPESGDFGPVEHIRKGPPPDPVVSLEKAVDRMAAEFSEGGVRLSEEHERICRRYGDEFFVVCNGGSIGVGFDEPNMLTLALRPELVARQMMHAARGAVALGRSLSGSPFPRVLVGGGDMAGNDGPFYSPAAFRQVMLPALKHMMAELRELGVHYMFRSDGNMWPVAEMLFGEAACPGFGEVDREAGMTMGALRERFPGLVVWGNMASGRLLSESAAWVRDEAATCIEESGGSRYFHGASNAILKGTPVENVLAMFACERVNGVRVNAVNV